MIAKAQVMKAMPRWGPNGEELVELTLKCGPHKKDKVTVPAPKGMAYREVKEVLLNTEEKTVEWPEAAPNERTA